MKLGLNVPNFGPAATPGAMRDWVRFAENHGFTIAMMSDHVALTRDVAEKYPAPFYDPFVTLSWMAGSATTLELGTTVTILPYRHPLLTARMAANIAAFTGGRFVLGVASGWAAGEFQALGLPFRRRGRMTEEYLRAITDAWAGGEVSMDGEFVRYSDVATDNGGARIWVGGEADAVLRRCARYAEAWHPNDPALSLAWFASTGLPRLRELAAEEDRPTPAFCPRIRVRITGTEPQSIGVGSLNHIAEGIAGLADLGADYVVLDTNPDQPADRAPAEDDWRILAAIANRVLR